MNDVEIIRGAFEAARQDVYGDGGLADAERALDRIVARLEAITEEIVLSPNALSALRRIGRSRDCNIAAALEEAVREFPLDSALLDRS